MCVEKANGVVYRKGYKGVEYKEELNIITSRLVQSRLCRVLGFLAVRGCMPDSSCAWTRRMLTVSTDPEGNKLKRERTASLLESKNESNLAVSIVPGGNKISG